jgi:hypothetical protein
VEEGVDMRIVKNRTLLREGVAVVLSAVMVFFGVTPAMAQVVPPPDVGTGPGGTVDNSGLIPFEQAFFAFEVESPLGTLKEVPIWDEIEQMLDDPYAFALEPSVAAGGTEPNAQGFPAYRLTQPRRRSFIYRNAAGEPCAPGSPGCTEQILNRHVIHPLNYNPGRRAALLNPEFAGSDGRLPPCIDPATNMDLPPRSIDTGAAPTSTDHRRLTGRGPHRRDEAAMHSSVARYEVPTSPRSPSHRKDRSSRR